MADLGIMHSRWTNWKMTVLECRPCQFACACGQIDNPLATCVDPGFFERVMDCIQRVPRPSLLIRIHLQDAICHTILRM